MNRFALHGDLLDFTGAPAWGSTEDAAVRWRPDHWLLVENGRIAGVQPEPPDASWPRIDHAGKLILPGFIDTHVHCPQLEVIASYGTELLDWLKTYTFPAEARWHDAEVARAGAARFLDALIAHGTTSAVVFPTVHKISAEALFEAGRERGMRLITGKVLMDRHAPENLRDDVKGAQADCEDLIRRFHGVERLGYAVTVRFAPTSTPEQLAMAGALCKADASLYMQTHVAENRDEVRWVAGLFPEARSYLDVYARVGLLHERSVLAHGIWLDEDDRAALVQSGAQVAHCPSSNLFLGSGLFAWREAREAGMALSMASDVGGGTSLSIQRNLLDAYKIQALRGERLTAWVGLHSATRGAAQALGLVQEIGSFDAGCMADICVWNWASCSVSAAREAAASGLHERLFAWMCLSDAGNLHAAYIAGRAVHSGSER
ncbi:MAG: guanine deaminase [Paucibacter sp.]|nr:guanine deaminase [Roseateles sp.]